MRQEGLDTVLVIMVMLIAQATVAACASPEGEREIADLVLRGGRVVTLDENRPEARGLAVKDHRILALGTDERIDEHIGPNTRVIELDGRLVIPGFIEGHGHFLSLGESLTVLDLRRAHSWDEIVMMVAQAVEETTAGEWILGRGWHQEKWSSPPEPAVDGSPLHHTLSAASPENPVLLEHASGHAAFANRMALEMAGLTRNSVAPPGGELVRDQHGELTGLLRETAQRVVWKAAESSRADRTKDELDADRRRLVELAGAEALAKGVTSFHDAGASFETVEFFRKLEEEGRLPVRLYVMVRHESNETMDARLGDYRMDFEDNDYLTVRSIKRQIDGALGAHGAWLLEPYEDIPGSSGLVLESEEEIRRTAQIAIRHGYQLNTHAIGDRANRRVLDIYEEVFAANADPSDLRWRVEHAQHLHPGDVPRFAELAVIASMQGVHCTSDGPWVSKRLGEARARSGAYLWRGLIDSGAVVTNGTDVPVEDIDPIASFHASVSRLMPDGRRFFPEQRMSREEALRSYTVNNAFAAFEEDHKGSLSPGKLADIVILSQDILTVPEEEIMATRVDFTIVGGKVRHERGEERGEAAGGLGPSAAVDR